MRFSASATATEIAALMGAIEIEMDTAPVSADTAAVLVAVTVTDAAEIPVAPSPSM